MPPTRPPTRVQIGPALYYLTTPIHPFLNEAIEAFINLVRATPNSLLCLIALATSLVLVCDGFRASEATIGARIALTGALGAVAAMYFRFVFRCASDAASHVRDSRLREDSR